ncbi:family 20 glycosylhydrolase [Mycoplasmopsis cynos]|uniref:family 20 glycosylhydrolase n=1 Tax=Mycoplasmopsis cynos TaxID=171284 RepID=UPI002AFECA2D|nr:family 20 glycosylhydrolase [Mycoplasmopsis cynos]WQQ17555.1 family 20 glycosylhydrolase [Mycoplasmopsis cynos]
MNLKRKFLLICGGMSSVILLPLALVSTNPTTNDGTEKGANIALGKSTEQNDFENGTEFKGSKAVDGDFNTRWATNQSDPSNGAKTLIIDLRSEQKVSSFQLFLERDNITGFKLFASNQKENLDNDANKVFEWIESEQNLRRTIYYGNFTSIKENVRYVMLKVTNWSESGRTIKPNLKWKNISVKELELYTEPMDLQNNIYNVLEKIQDWRPTINADGNKITLPEGIDSSRIEIHADYEQIIDSKGNVFKPLTSKTVELLVIYTDKKGKKHKVKPASNLEVTGKFVQQENKNPKPKVAVEIAEWYSNSNENLKLNKDFKIFVKGKLDEKLNKMFNELKLDFKDIFNKEIEIKSFVDSDTTNGNIVFDLTENKIPGYDEETYEMIIDNDVTIKAANRIGAFWSTRTLLQMLKSSENFELPKGQMKDYPKFKKRGLSFDVGRKAVSMDILKAIVKEMSWYKMNELQVHLSDNLIFLEDYVSDKKEDKDIERSFDAYSGWRLESSKYKEVDGKKVYLHNEDYHYTIDEFKKFMNDSNDLSVNIVPELDFPAHALSITKIWKEFAVKKFGTNANGKRTLVDHIDITNPEAVKLIKEILDDYTNEGKIFDKNSRTTVHIGCDEFFDSPDAYYDFANEMFKYFIDKGIRVRLWGSFSHIRSASKHIKEEYKDKVEMNIWSLGWANPSAMYDEGYKLINTLDSPTYMVPNGTGSRGAYGDFLNNKNIYDNYEANIMGNSNIPSGSSQMLGGMYAIWGDSLLDVRATGVSEYDLFERFKDALPYFATKVWGIGSDGLDSTFEEYRDNVISKIGSAPNSNPSHKIKLEKNSSHYFSYDFKGSSDSEKLLDKKGKFGIMNLSSGMSTSNEEGISSLKVVDKTAKAATNIDLLGFNNRIKFVIKRQKVSDVQEEEVIFSADTPYGQLAIKARQKGSTKFGFSRELMDYTFDYELPYDKWVEIELVSEFDNAKKVAITKLFVNGKETGGKPVGTNGSRLIDKKTGEYKVEHTFTNSSSLFIPLQYIGDGKNTFKGYITNIEHSLNEADKNKFEKSVLENIDFSLKLLKNNNVTASDISIEGIDKDKIMSDIQLISKDDKKLVVKVTLSYKNDPNISIVKNKIIDLENKSDSVIEPLKPKNNKDNKKTKEEPNSTNKETPKDSSDKLLEKTNDDKNTSKIGTYIASAIAAMFGSIALVLGVLLFKNKNK